MQDFPSFLYANLSSSNGDGCVWGRNEKSEVVYEKYNRCCGNNSSSLRSRNNREVVKRSGRQKDWLAPAEKGIVCQPEDTSSSLSLRQRDCWRFLLASANCAFSIKIPLTSENHLEGLVRKPSKSMVGHLWSVALVTYPQHVSTRKISQKNTTCRLQSRHSLAVSLA